MLAFNVPLPDAGVTNVDGVTFHDTFPIGTNSTLANENNPELQTISGPLRLRDVNVGVNEPLVTEVPQVKLTVTLIGLAILGVPSGVRVTVLDEVVIGPDQLLGKFHV